MINTKTITILALFSSISFSAYSEPVQTDTFLQKLLRISGISATPQQMRGEDKGQAGQIWIVNIKNNQQRQVASTGDFRSPVYLPDDTGLLVLKKNELIKISLADGVQSPLFQIPGIIKIIGFDQSDADRFLILLEDDQLELVSLQTGTRESLDYPTNKEAETFLSHIKSWNRVYGDTQINVKTRRKRTILGHRSISNIYYQHTDLSRCIKSSCSQPSLSHDGQSVVFIKSD